MGHTKHHMKAKHHRKSGGRVVYEGASSHVAHEAEEKKHGGRVHHDVHGHKGKHRIKKKRGGAVGADHHPFSSAAKHGMANSPAEHHGGHTSGFVAGHGKD